MDYLGGSHRQNYYVGQHVEAVPSEGDFLIRVHMILFPHLGTSISGLVQRRTANSPLLLAQQTQACTTILSGCKSALTWVSYRWHHDHVLRDLAKILEASRLWKTKSAQEHHNLGSMQ